MRLLFFFDVGPSRVLERFSCDYAGYYRSVGSLTAGEPLLAMVTELENVAPEIWSPPLVPAKVGEGELWIAGTVLPE